MTPRRSLVPEFLKINKKQTTKDQLAQEQLDETRRRRDRIQLEAWQNSKDVEKSGNTQGYSSQAMDYNGDYHISSLEPPVRTGMSGPDNFCHEKASSAPSKGSLTPGENFSATLPVHNYIPYPGNVGKNHVDESGVTMVNTLNTEPASNSPRSEVMNSHGTITSKISPPRAQSITAAEIPAPAMDTNFKTSPTKTNSPTVHDLTTHVSGSNELYHERTSTNASLQRSEANILMHSSETASPHGSHLHYLTHSRGSAQHSQVQNTNLGTQRNQTPHWESEQHLALSPLENEAAVRNPDSRQQNKVRDMAVPDGSLGACDDMSLQHDPCVGRQRVRVSQSPQSHNTNERLVVDFTNTEEIRDLRQQHEAEIIALRESIQKISEEARISKEALELSHSEALSVSASENWKLSEQLKAQACHLEATEKSLTEFQLYLGQKTTELESARQMIISLESHAGSAKSKIDSFRKALNDSKQEIELLKQQLNGSASEFQWLKQSHARDLARIEQLQADERAEHRRDLDDLEQKLRSSESEARNRYKALKSKYKTELDTLHQNLVVAKDKHTQEMRGLAESNRQEAQQVAHGHHREVQKLNEQFRASEETYNQEYRRIDGARLAEISDLKSQHKAAVDALQRSLNTAALEAKQSRQRIISEHNQSIEKLKTEQSAKLSRQQAEHLQAVEGVKLQLTQQASAHEAALKQQSQKHKTGTTQLRKEVEQLNAMLLTNDDDVYRGELFKTDGLPAQPDDKLAASFSAVALLVEDIGRRLQWKTSPRVWTNDILQKIRGDHIDRVLKKAIVQDLVWSLLYEYIFASPFRVFDGEGRMLEVQWNHECGSQAQGQPPPPPTSSSSTIIPSPSDNTSDSSASASASSTSSSPTSPKTSQAYTWPVPSAKTERWRYLTIRECRDALRPPVPSDWDPRIRLRQGFTASLAAFQASATTQLGNIVDLSPVDVDTLERLATKAATVWLRFAAHRCRIVVQLATGPSGIGLSMEEKVAVAVAIAAAAAAPSATATGGDTITRDIDNLAQGSASSTSTSTSTRDRTRTRAHTRNLELTVVPKVVRHGNVMGTDLDSHKIIDRCDGESLVIGKY